MDYNKPNRGIIISFLLCFAVLNIVQGFPSQGDDLRYIDVSPFINMYIKRGTIYIFKKKTSCLSYKINGVLT